MQMQINIVNELWCHMDGDRYNQSIQRRCCTRVRSFVRSFVQNERCHFRQFHSRKEVAAAAGVRGQAVTASVISIMNNDKKKL